MSRADRDRLAARAEDLIDHLVRHDALTELPNRVMFRDCVGEAIADARRPGALVAVVILGLDRFQAINDSWGPPFGDLVLQAIGRRLSGALLEGDTAARLGGDQFGMLRPTIHTADQAGALARRLLESIARPICIDRCEVYPAATAVVALYPTDAGEADGLIRDAEIAMHRAKAAGGHRVRFYTAEMNARSLDRLLLENGLHRALERNELRVHYQPQLSLAERRIAGLEALLRWKPAYRTSVDTADVIAVADESGLIVPIGEWVLRTACADLASWHRAGHTGLRVSVNLSARQLAWGGLVSVVAHALRDAELDPSCLELEITENSLLENSPGADETLRRLTALGVRLALDDFGSGYSSLTHLKRFPIDILKIDRSFIHDLVSSRSDAAITRAIISMAHALDLAVIAEGVERHDQLELLRAEGCDFVQGYLIGRPMPAGQVPETLRRLPGGESAGASRPSGLDLGLTPALRLAGARDGADGLADQLGERHPEERAGRDIARVMGADVNSAEAD